MSHKIGSGKEQPQKKNEFTVGMMVFFLVGCVAEAYLLMVRHYYVDGLIEQVVAWDTIVQRLAVAGLAVLALGAVLLAVWRRGARAKRIAAGTLTAVGAFLAASGWIVRTFYPNGASLLCVVVLAIVAGGLVWKLYDRECVYALILLALTTLAVWICRHGLRNLYWGKWVLAGACCYLALVCVAWLLLRRTQKNKGQLGKLRLLPPSAGYTALYGCCALSILVVAAALVSTTIAYYALWLMAIAIFALALYFTVKQL